MIEVPVSPGTDADRKTRLLAALVEVLDAAGTDPNDIMVFFGEIHRASIEGFSSATGKAKSCHNEYFGVVRPWQRGCPP